MEKGVPEHIRSDNGPEFVAKEIKDWLAAKLGVKTLYIEPGSPWENGYNESFNGKLRYDLLDGEIFDTLWEAKVIVERWRKEYNTRRPHSSLGQLPPAPEAWILELQDAAYAVANGVNKLGLWCEIGSGTKNWGRSPFGFDSCCTLESTTQLKISLKKPGVEYTDNRFGNDKKVIDIDVDTKGESYAVVKEFCLCFLKL